MADVIEYYIAFTEFTYEKKFKGNCVPMVKYVIEKGNTTTYEWKYGEPPISVEEPPFATNFNDDEPDNLDENNQDNVSLIEYSCVVLFPFLKKVWVYYLFTDRFRRRQHKCRNWLWRR